MNNKAPQKNFFFILMALGFAINAKAQECLPEVVVTGYSPPSGPDFAPIIIAPIANLYPPNPPTPTTSPGGKFSANPNAHTNCTTKTLTNAIDAGSSSAVSQPQNTSLAIPMRYQNPIDIVNNSSVGASYGGTNGPAGFMVFPNLAAGTNAALKSLSGYAQKGMSVYGVIATWAPTSINPSTLNNTLLGLGIDAGTASHTLLSSLTAAQLLQVIAAFSWQEGFKPAGC